jgi:hypothetical protein
MVLGRETVGSIYTTPVSDVAPPQPIKIAANVVAEMMNLKSFD